jgi:hypothetical protein
MTNQTTNRNSLRRRNSLPKRRNPPGRPLRENSVASSAIRDPSQLQAGILIRLFREPARAGLCPIRMRRACDFRALPLHVAYPTPAEQQLALFTLRGGAL